MYKKTMILTSILLLSGCSSELADKLGAAAMKGWKAGKEKRLRTNSSDKENKNPTVVTSKVTKVKKIRTPKYKTIEDCFMDNKWKNLSMVTMGKICEENTKKTESSQSKLSVEEKRKLNDCIGKYPAGQFFADEMCADKLGLKLTEQPSRFGI